MFLKEQPQATASAYITDITKYKNVLLTKPKRLKDLVLMLQQQQEFLILRKVRHLTKTSLKRNSSVKVLWFSHKYLHILLTHKIFILQKIKKALAYLEIQVYCIIYHIVSHKKSER